MAKVQLPLLIRRLLDAAIYPHPVEQVQLVQTHISYVLLAGDYAYKIKKPVDFGFLDYSTLRKRLYYCQQEVALNRRFCAEIYLGVVPIRERGGCVSFDGGGKVVEYAVKMRRLPEDHMLHRLLARGEASVALMKGLAERLAESHRQAETSPSIARYGGRNIRYAWHENFRQWAPFVGETLAPEQNQLLQTYVRSYFRRNRALLRRRVDELRIRDCHGDLRSDSICYLDGNHVCIFDCIEFNRRFRYTDVAGDVGFLAMDLEYRGHPELAEAFVRRYLEVSGDKDLGQLLDFYRCYRAAVRGKVEGFRLREPEVSTGEKREALKAARRYFALACRYAQRDQPLLIAMCGLTGTGKSTLARDLAQELNLEVVSSDVVRKELAGLGPQERRFEPFGQGIYSWRFTDRTYRQLLERAKAFLREGRSVIADASFARSKHRLWAKRLAMREGAKFFCLECQASDGTVHRRLARRLREGLDPSDARWEIYLAQKGSFEPVVELAAGEHLVVKPLGSREKAVQKVKQAVANPDFVSKK